MLRLERRLLTPKQCAIPRRGETVRRMAAILVIDSEPGTRAAIVHAIQALGEIEEAANGADALRLLAAKKFALVILDLHVRPLDGFVILRTLAAKGGPNKATPVYVIAADQAEQARAIKEHHAVFALTKPVKIPTVVNLVDAGLRKMAQAAQASEQRPNTSTIPPPALGSSPPAAAEKKSPVPPPPPSSPDGDRTSRP